MLKGLQWSSSSTTIKSFSKATSFPTSFSPWASSTLPRYWVHLQLAHWTLPREGKYLVLGEPLLGKLSSPRHSIRPNCWRSRHSIWFCKNYLHNSRWWRLRLFFLYFKRLNLWLGPHWFVSTPHFLYSRLWVPWMREVGVY